MYPDDIEQNLDYYAELGYITDVVVGDGTVSYTVTELGAVEFRKDQ